MQSLDIRRGSSTASDEAIAVRELAAAIRTDDTALAIFYCATSYNLDRLAEQLQQYFAGVHLIGCTTAGEISSAGYLNGSLTGVSIGTRNLRAVSTRFGVGPFQSASGVAAVQALQSQLAADGPPAQPGNTFGFLLIDGLSMQEEIVSSCLHQHLHGIQLFGGSAGDDVNFSRTLVYHDGQFHRDCAVLALLQTELPFYVFRTQHFVASDTRMVVTGADPARRIVYEINGRPAAPEFARAVNLDVAALTPMIFSTYPVVVRLGGEYFVRSIQKVNDDGSLTFFCAIDEGLVLTVARGQDMIDSLERTFREVRERVGPPQLVLACDCVLRRLELEQRGAKQAAADILASNNVVGFATYGEQFNSLHLNQTLTGVAIGAGK